MSGATIPVGPAPGFVTVSPNGHHVYAVNQGTPKITVVDPMSNQVIGTIDIPEGPAQFLTFAPDGNKMYVTIFNDQKTVHGVDVVDTRSNAVIATVQQKARPYYAAPTPDGKRLLVLNHDVATVSVIDAETNRLSAEIKTVPNPQWIAFAPDGRFAYTANHESNVISVIDMAALTVTATVPVGKSPHSVAVNPTRPLLASANYDDGSVSIVDTGSRQLVARVPVGRNPRAIAWAPDGRFAYVVNEADNSVSVIDSSTNKRSAASPKPRGQGLRPARHQVIRCAHVAVHQGFHGVLRWIWRPDRRRAARLTVAGLSAGWRPLRG